MLFQGAFVGVIGKVGSGKSSLLNAILGEMHKDSGDISISVLTSGFGMSAQEPWIQHATVRENILFGQPFERARYEAVVFACALNEDLKVKDCPVPREWGIYINCFEPVKTLSVTRYMSRSSSMMICNYM